MSGLPLTRYSSSSISQAIICFQLEMLWALRSRIWLRLTLRFSGSPTQQTSPLMVSLLQAFVGQPFQWWNNLIPLIAIVIPYSSHALITSASRCEPPG